MALMVYFYFAYVTFSLLVIFSVLWLSPESSHWRILWRGDIGCRSLRWSLFCEREEPRREPWGMLLLTGMWRVAVREFDRKSCELWGEKTLWRPSTYSPKVHRHACFLWDRKSKIQAERSFARPILRNTHAPGDEAVLMNVSRCPRDIRGIRARRSLFKYN